MSNPNSTDEELEEATPEGLAGAYRTPVVSPESASARTRAPSRMLSALAALSAARDLEGSRDLAQRAAEARTDERARELEQRRCLRAAAIEAIVAGDWSTAQTSILRAIALGEARPVDDRTQWATDLAIGATTLRAFGKFATSEETFRQAAHHTDGELDPSTPALVVHDLAVLLIHAGRLPAARRLLEAASARCTDDADAMRLRHALAECSLEEGDLVSAEWHLAITLRGRAALLGDQHPLHAATVATSGRLQLLRGELTLAERTLRSALDVLHAQGGVDATFAQTLLTLALVLAQADRKTVAVQLVDDAKSTLAKYYRAEHPALCRALRVEETIARTQGKLREADAARDRRRAIEDAWAITPPL